MALKLAGSPPVSFFPSGSIRDFNLECRQQRYNLSRFRTLKNPKTHFLPREAFCLVCIAQAFAFVSSGVGHQGLQITKPGIIKP